MIKTTYVGALRSIYSTLSDEYRSGGVEILRKHHLSKDHLHDLKGRLPMELMTSIWDDCFHMTGDRLFGIKASARISTVNLHGIDRLLLAAPTIGYGLRLYPYLVRLLHFDLNMGVSTDSVGNLVYELPGPAALAYASPTACAYTMCLHFKVFESLCGLPIRDCIDRLCVTGRSIEARTWLAEKCADKVSVADKASISFRKELLQRPPPHANSRLFTHLERSFLQVMAAERQPLPFISLVNQLSINPAAVDDLTSLGACLDIDPHLLQTSLELAGESMLSLQDKARQAAATRLLDAGQLSVKQIADVCGYASSTSFIRAFDRWHGCTPKLFRESMGQSYQRL